MPLQNRVTPCGDIVALAGRGLIMGNRGVLHDDGGRIVRAWQNRRWIACRLEFRGRRRPIMQARRWTELFFLDEATAFGAGHRPCAECRHADFTRFRLLWEACHGSVAGAAAVDARLHAERLVGKRKRTYRAALGSLPDGAFVRVDGAPLLVWKNELFAWSDSGYAQRRLRPRASNAEVLTPRSIVAVLAAGYVPDVHSSARGLSRTLILPAYKP